MRSLTSDDYGTQMLTPGEEQHQSAASYKPEEVNRQLGAQMQPHVQFQPHAQQFQPQRQFQPFQPQQPFQPHVTTASEHDTTAGQSSQYNSYA